jgi:hypothetical protein
MSQITLDVKYAQELIDFWSTRYDTAKTELEAAQVRVDPLSFEFPQREMALIMTGTKRRLLKK